MSEQIATHALRYTQLEPVERRWTAEDFDKLRAAWKDPNIPRADLPRHVGRTEEACDRMARLLGLGRRPAKRARQGHEWAPEELAVLHDHWPDIPAIYSRITRTVGAIEKQARNQGLPPKTGAVKGPLPHVVRNAKAESRLVIRPNVQVVRRNCLCCGVGFEAPTRFIRLCNPCKGQRG